MRWVTRKHLRVNRVATAWLIRRFVDAQAEFIFVEPAEVAEVQRVQGAIGFDAPGARYAHDHGITSFEQIVRERHTTDAALLALTRIVHAADVPGALLQVPEAA